MTSRWTPWSGIALHNYEWHNIVLHCSWRATAMFADTQLAIGKSEAGQLGRTSRRCQLPSRGAAARTWSLPCRAPDQKVRSGYQPGHSVCHSMFLSRRGGRLFLACTDSCNSSKKKKKYGACRCRRIAVVDRASFLNECSWRVKSLGSATVDGDAMTCAKLLLGPCFANIVHRIGRSTFFSVLLRIFIAI